jgi:hypothetical protein
MVIRIIKNYLHYKKVEDAIKKANSFHSLTNKRFYVLAVGKKVNVYSKQDLKRLISTHMFKKGFKVEDLERIAIFKTI